MGKQYKEGELLFTSSPLAYVLVRKQHGTRCEHCLMMNEKLLRCASCREVKYCSKACQRQDWKLHKHECSCMKRVAPLIPKDSVRFMFRLLVQLQIYDGLKKVENIFGKDREFAHLMSHADDIKKTKKRCEESVQMAQALKVYAGNNIQMPPTAEFFELFGKMMINSHSILNEDHQVIGTGLYLGVSVLDHSCQPNSVVTFSGATANVRCMEAFVGETEARISYVSTLDTTAGRRSQLLEQYYFTCDCSACGDIARDRKMNTTICTQTGCQGAVIDTDTSATCDSCGFTLEQDRFKLRNEVLEFGTTTVEETREAIKNSGINSMYPIVAERIAEHNYLHIWNIRWVQLQEMAFDECIAIAEWNRAVRHGKYLLAGYEMYLQMYNPMLAMVRMKIAKILVLQGHLKEALELLSKSRAVVVVTHGEKHPLYGFLVELITQAWSGLRK